MGDFKEEIVSIKEIKNRTLLSFSFLLLFLIGCFVTWKWIHNQPEDNGVPRPLRNILNTNENVFGYFFKGTHLAKVFPASAASPQARVNGDAGMNSALDTAAWKLKLVRNPGNTIYISLAEIKALPKTDVIFDFKCIEGWSQVTHWAGVKFSDFVARYGLQKQSELAYTGLSTPDNEYYVGIDNRSMIHPQTILCYELNGKPLPMDQGAPLRLIIPVKYGVKHLKRIGTMFFSNYRPKDYWFERGYDYYCGL